MAKDNVRIGIIGVGQIGKSHIQGYKNVRGAEIVAIADVNEAEAKRVAAENGIGHVTTDFRKLLKRTDVEAVDVCLHNNFHMPVTVAALRAGKHVYCEKPMAGSFADAQTMMDAAQKTGRKLSIQLSTLFARETRAAKRLIDEGRLGRLYHARSYGFRRRGRPFVDGYGSAQFVQKEVAAGGALYDMGVYHIAQVLYLLGLPVPERISGKVYQECPMDAARQKSSGFNVEELGCGFVRFKRGLTLDILESWAIHIGPFEGSFITGNQGGVRLSPFSYHTYLGDMVMDGSFDLGEADYRWHQLDERQSAYDSPQHHWIAALQGRVPLEPTAEVARLTMLISEGIYLSDRLGREVTADEVAEKSTSSAVKV